MKNQLALLTPEERHARSLDACNNLVASPEFKRANLLMIYLSMSTEVETAALAIKAWQEGKSIAAPRIDWENKKMEPIELTSLDTGLGHTGPNDTVREPLTGKIIPLDLVDLIVIPGMAFDRKGFRVGRGKGFYDRFLARQDFQGVRCGFCFSEQLLATPVPREPHDIPMHLIVTDKEILHCPAPVHQRPT